MKRIIAIAALAAVLVGCASTSTVEDQGPVSFELQHLASYQTGLFDESGAEIVAFHGPSASILFVNADLGGVVRLDQNLQVTSEWVFDGYEANSVAVSGDRAAIALASDGDEPAKGLVAIIDLNSEVVVEQVEVGYLPDMVTFTNDGSRILVANEGEPSDDYSIDPPGSVSIIDWASFEVTELFFDESHLVGDVRITKGEARVDLEPEYIAVDGNDSFAYVSLQENNAIAKIDLSSEMVVGVYDLGYIDHSQEGFYIDAIEEGTIAIEAWPVRGLPMPDTISSIEIDGETYILTANEGDGREYGDYEDEVGADDWSFNPEFFSAEDIERLADADVNITLDSDRDGDGVLDVAYSFGTRSFSIFTSELERIFDSGDDFETIIAEDHPHAFNVSDGDLEIDGRSGNKGPEPEALASAYINGIPLAFVGLERDGGIAIYDLRDPSNAKFLSYQSSRNYDAEVDEDFEYSDESYGNTGALAPEGMAVVPAELSPTGTALLIVGYEVSGTVSVYEIVQN